MLLENEKIRLRAVEPEDLDQLYRWENKPELWSVGNTRQPYSRYILKQYILHSDKDIYETHQLRLMIDCVSTGQTAGTVDLFDFDIHNSRIALGLYVDTKFQGKGIATCALHLIEQYVFDYLKINQLYCHIAESNTASRKIFEKQNYESNGVLKNWIKTDQGFENVILFQSFRANYTIKKILF